MSRPPRFHRAARVASGLGLLVSLLAVPAAVADAQVVIQAPGGRGGGGRGGVVVAPGPPGGVVVAPPRRGGTVVAPPPSGGVVVQPARPGGVVIGSEPRPGGVVIGGGARPGAVVVQPGRPGVVVQPGRPGVVVAPPTPGGYYVPREVMVRPPSRMRVVAPPPPPRSTARWGPPRRGGEVWIDPFWGWTGSSWEWVDGRWEFPPQPGAIWVAPQFDGRDWVPGYWTMVSFSGSVPATLGRPYQLGASIAGSLDANDPRDPTGNPYHDHVVSLSAGQTVSFLAVGGPADQAPGQRISLALSVMFNGMVVAAGGGPGTADAQVVFTAQRPGIHVIRVLGQSGPYGTGTYVLQSANGAWAPQTSLYDQYWGASQAPQAAPGWAGQPSYGASVATPIQLGMTTQGTLQPGDVVDGSGSFVDDHVLALAPGQEFTVIARGGPSMTGRSTLDVVLQLLVDGQEIGRDDDSAGDRNARLIASSPYGGNVVLRVSTWRGSAERAGTYTLTVLPGTQPMAR